MIEETKDGISRDMMVRLVELYGKWITDNAEDIVGANIQTLTYDDCITVRFSVNRTETPTVNVERKSSCEDRFICLFKREEFE